MRDVYCGAEYRGYKVMFDQDHYKYGQFYREPLDRINDLLCFVRENYRKAFFIRVDLQFPDGTDDAKEDSNELFGKFIENIRISYARRGYRPLYFWVREYDKKEGRYHYHVVFVVCGHMMQRADSFFKDCSRKWAYLLRCSVEDAPVNYGYDPKFRGAYLIASEIIESGGVMIKHYKDKEEVLDRYSKLYYLLTYLAKSYSKFINPNSRVRNFGCSTNIDRNRYKKLTVADVDEWVRNPEEEHLS